MSSTPSAGQAFLRANSITKHFGGIAALRGVDLEIRPGEVHALKGENGAGKSTLAKILAGVELADAGSIELDGRPVQFHSTTQAAAAGIVIVLQELSLIADLTVAENIFLTHREAYTGGWWLNRRAIRDKTRALFQQLGWEHPIDPDRLVGELSVAEQQLVEIVRALAHDTSIRLVILDEPTASLSNTEVKFLFDVVRRLKAQNVSFLFVTHRLEEVFALADRITVFRDGLRTGEFLTAETNTDALIRAMVGRDLSDLMHLRHRRAPGQEVLGVKGLSRGRQVRDVTLQVRAGEIVGLAGLVGAGRTELVRAVFGADRAEGGQVVIKGKAGLLRSPQESLRRKAALVPEDRKRQGLLIDLPIMQNLTLTRLAASKAFWLRAQDEESGLAHMVEKLAIKAPQLWRSAGTLSGGNQQKVVLAKWLLTQPDLLILDEPTRGVDVGAKYELYRLIDELAGQGAAVLLVSSELPEIMALADRILVMAGGALVGEFAHDEASEAAIVACAASGQQHPVAEGV